MLIGENISKAFGKREVLRDVSVAVPSGQITAVIGPSGGGKSTLIRALSLLDPPDVGTVTLDQHVYVFPHGKRDKGPKPPWPQLTVVFQQLFLWPHLSIWSNITLPLLDRRANQGMSDGEIRKLTDYFELSGLVDRFPNQVSLGQRQRAALVRALALKPRYLLLDEITSALDVEHISKVLEYLQLIRDQGTGILLVTHLIGFARSAAGQIVFMENGKVLARGTPQELLVSPSNNRLARFLSLVETAA